MPQWDSNTSAAVQSSHVDVPVAARIVAVGVRHNVVVDVRHIVLVDVPVVAHNIAAAEHSVAAANTGAAAART